MRRFEKVSYEQFEKDFISAFPNLIVNKDTIKEKYYDQIKLPQRSTYNAVGYDFFTYFGFKLNPGEEIKIPTGIKVNLDRNIQLPVIIDGKPQTLEAHEFLSGHSRSGQGFKYLRLANVTAIIDADYVDSKNTGHIYIKVRNESTDKQFSFEPGNAYCQGIIQLALLTDNDSDMGVYQGQREGGLGSTGN